MYAVELLPLSDIGAPGGLAQWQRWATLGGAPVSDSGEGNNGRDKSGRDKDAPGGRGQGRRTEHGQGGRSGQSSRGQGGRAGEPGQDDGGRQGGGGGRDSRDRRSGRREDGTRRDAGRQGSRGGSGSASGRGRQQRGGSRTRDERSQADPPRPRREGSRPSKPTLPSERPHLPRDVYADIRSAASPNEVDDVARALGAAEEAVDRGAATEAVALLEWAKAAASRSWAVREGLGVAYYLSGRYADAHRELLAYRRLSGRQDQNHLLADCARATGHPDRAREHLEAMIGAGVSEDRVVEALLVVAGARLDADDPEGAVATLERARLYPREPQPHHLRLWHLLGRAHEAAGDPSAARYWRERIADVDEEALDVLDGNA